MVSVERYALVKMTNVRINEETDDDVKDRLFTFDDFFSVHP